MSKIQDLINDLDFISRYPRNSNAPYVCRLAIEQLTKLEKGAEKIEELEKEIEKLKEQKNRAIDDIVKDCHLCKHYNESGDCPHKKYEPKSSICLGWTWHGE